MTTWQRWLKRPQNVWLRKALFQIHLWTGIGVGLYILVASVSGSAVVFRNEIYKAADTGPRIVEVKSEPLSETDLKAAANKAYPGQSIRFIWPGKEKNYATEIWMEKDGSRNQRLFDPYTGADLGPSIPYAIQITSWFMDLHTDLLGGETGRKVNGWGSVLLTILSITGLILWWPGLDKWKRALWINPKSGWKKINWDLHSAIGFWTFALTFMWAVTGIYLVWPLPFQKVVNHYSPLIQYALPEEDPEEGAALSLPVSLPAGVFAQPSDKGTAKGKTITLPGQAFEQAEDVPTFNFGKGKGRRQPIRRSKGDIFLRWWYYLHFGNFAGNKTKALWVALGLLPAFLFVTGAIMWWNRLLSPSARRAKRAAKLRAQVPGQLPELEDLTEA